MKHFFSLLLFISLTFPSFSQVIKGIVLDKKTHDTISFATIYINGTFIGTNSDVHGKFRLDISKNPGMPITVSAIGYYSATFTDFSPSRPLLVYLVPKVYELQEVVVNSTPFRKKRLRDLRIFREQFLGRTNNANDCKILNENDITFNYKTDEDTVKAYASKPLVIDNQALGYKIVYFLDKFEYYKSTASFIFKGTIIFSEDFGSSISGKKTFERKRKNAYVGSRMQFFRVLWANELEKNGYFVKNTSAADLAYSNIVREDANKKKFLTFPEKLTIYYYKQASVAILLKDKVAFESSGFYDPAGISWEGEMAMQRIADWLPYEYNGE